MGEFLGTFNDSRIVESLDARWPNEFDGVMPNLDANMLHMFNQWKVTKYSGEIAIALTQHPPKVHKPKNVAWEYVISGMIVGSTLIYMGYRANKYYWDHRAKRVDPPLL